MTIRIARRRREDLRFVISVFFDGQLVAALEPGASVELDGDSTDHDVTLVVEGKASHNFVITDPGDGRLVRVTISYRNLRNPSSARKRLVVKKIEDPPQDPTELDEVLNTDSEARQGWNASSGALKIVYSAYISAPRRVRTRMARAVATAEWAKTDGLDQHVQHLDWKDVVQSLDFPGP